MQLFSELPLNGETEQRRDQSSPVDGGRMSLEALEALAASEIYPGCGNGPREAGGGRGGVYRKFIDNITDRKKAA